MPKRRPTKPQIPDARRIFESVKEVATRTVSAEVEDFAYEGRDSFVEQIENQAFASFQVIFYPESGTNLSPEWLRRKELAGADLRTMIATRHYIDSIDVFTKYDRKAKVYQVRVGFHPNAKPRDLKGRAVEIEIPGTGITGLTALGIVHELGSIKARIPARPHWRPHRERLRKEAAGRRKQMRTAVLKAIKRKRLPVEVRIRR